MILEQQGPPAIHFAVARGVRLAALGLMAQGLAACVPPAPPPGPTATRPTPSAERSAAPAASSAPPPVAVATPGPVPSPPAVRCEATVPPTADLIALIDTGDWPKAVELSRDERWALTTDFSSNSLTIINVETLEVAKRIRTGTHSPVEAAYLPDGERALISGGYQSSALLVFDVKNQRLLGPLPGMPEFLRFPKIVRVSPDDREVWVSFWVSDKVAVFDSSTLRLLRLVKTDRNPRGIAFTPDGKKAYIAAFCNECRNGSAITVHDATTGARIGSIPNLRSPRHIVVSSDGAYAYASILASGEIVQIDTATDQIVRRVSVGEYPKTIDLDRCDHYLYVANHHSDTIAIVDTRRMEVVRTIDAGKEPCGLTLSHEDTRLWTTDWGDGKVRVYDLRYDAAQ